MLKRIFLAVLLVQLGVLFASAQSLRITGQVLDDSTNAGLPNVSVVVAETKAGVSTDAQGKFTITTPARSSVTLIITYVGYRSQTITTDGKSPVIIQLRKEQAQMEEVIVIGYQTVRRKDVLASVSSVGAKELKDIPINNAAEALNGRLAGVTATTAEGSPDADVRVRVRGGMSITQDNSPLYIIDGVQVENGLNSISPQDIQDITVLKDAAATAIYGARGANGVIVITTKSGRPGKLTLNYNALYGIKRLATKLDVLKPYDYIVHAYERVQANTQDSSEFAKNFGSTFDTLSVYRNLPFVDWQDEVMNRPGHLMTHNVNFGGGSRKGTYNFSYTYNDDKAIVLNSRFKRHLFNLKGDYNLTKNLKVGIGTRYTNTNVLGAGVSTDNSGSSFARLRNTIKYRPFLSEGQGIAEQDPFAPDNVANGLILVNPIQLADAEFRNKLTNAFNVTAHATYKITKRIQFKSTFGYDYNKQYDDQFYDSIAPIARSQGGSRPMVVLDTTVRKVITNSNVFTYNLDNFAKNHDLNILLGEETYQLELERDGRSLRDFPLYTSKDQAFDQQQLGTLIGSVPRHYRSKYTSLSFFTNVRYGFKDRYLFSFNLRADGASKFAPGRQWGYFPSASVAWRVKKENFLENVNWINDMKFRFGYGTVGNNRIGDYLSLTKFRSDQLYYGLNGVTVPAYNSTSLVNELLKWESTVNRNFGFDLTLLRNRIDLSVDYFYNTSKDLLLEVPIAATFGYAEQLQNVGATSNRGFEVQLNATILRKKNNLNWTANFNISTYKTRVDALGYQSYFHPDRGWGLSTQPEDYIVRVGDPVGSMFGWVSDGFYTLDDFSHVNDTFRLKPGVASMAPIAGGSQPGQVKFRDLNGDGVVDNQDRTIIGNATPKFTGGLNQQLTYKNWDMSIFFNFSFGNDILNANKIEFSTPYAENANVLEIVGNRWKTIDANGNVIQRQVTAQNASGQNEFYAVSNNPAALRATNANASMWWMPYGAQNAFYPHSWAIEDGSFVRLNNLTIGYTLPATGSRKIGLSKLRFYFTGNNLAIFTKYTGYVPEVSVRNSGLTPGLDYSAYPKSRSFIFGLNATF